MFAILVSWLVIFFVLFSFGNMLLSIVGRLLNLNESYNIIEQQILGLVFLVVPLSLWSFWLPVNHYCLLFIVTISLIYWVLNWSKLKLSWARLAQTWCNLTLCNKLVLLLFCLLAVSIYVWEEGVLDSIFYHQQAIRWAEEYAIVPGLGNLEDRLALNSNYLLISSLFTFRFVFDQAIYSVNNWFVVIVGCWCLVELFRSKYELRRICLVVVFFIFFILNVKLMQNTSTDILSNIVAFYVLARLILSPNFYNKHEFLYAMLPAFLMTCKLAFIPFLLISLFVYISICKRGGKREALFLLSFVFVVVILWLIRNVILSGYLVYPMHYIDIFSFDWKIPKQIAKEQVYCIARVGYDYLIATLHGEQNSGRDPLWIVFITLGLYVLSIISTIGLLFFMLKNKRRSFVLLLIFVCLLLSLILWLFNGPDSRFVSGLLCLLVFFGASVYLDSMSEKFFYPKIGGGCLFVFFLFLSVWSFRQTKSRYESFAQSSVKALQDKKFIDVLYKPCVFSFYLKLTTGTDVDEEVETYVLNNGVVIYISKIRFSFDRLPYTAEYGTDWKLSDYRDLEARGGDLSDGFRSKLEKP